jgi:hypothetical protein
VLDRRLTYVLAVPREGSFSRAIPREALPGRARVGVT